MFHTSALFKYEQKNGCSAGFEKSIDLSGMRWFLLAVFRWKIKKWNFEVLKCLFKISLHHYFYSTRFSILAKCAGFFR